MRRLYYWRRLLAADGYWRLLATGYWLLAAGGYWVLATGCWRLLATGCWMLVVGRWLWLLGAGIVLQIRDPAAVPSSRNRSAVADGT